MAGFDFDVGVHPADKAVLQRLLRIVQRVGHETGGVRVTYRAQQNRTYRVEVDGPLYMMQAMVRPLRTTLPDFAEGAATAQTRTRRVRLGVRLAATFEESVMGMTETISDIARQLGSVPGVSFFFPAVRDPVVQARLDGFTMLILSFTAGDVGGEPLVEDCHTILELMMNRVLGDAARGKSWEQMADAVASGGLISQPMRDAIVRLKNERRGAKHRGQTIADDLAGTLVGEAMPACHRLADAFR